MSIIRLAPKFESIKNKLISKNHDSLHKNSEYNKLVDLIAQMVAQGIQMYEESLDNDKE